MPATPRSRKPARRAARPGPDLATLDRHALVTTVWLPFGLASLTLLHFGLASGSAAFILLGFAALLAGFIGHVIVNAATKSDFTLRERATGLVAYLAGLVGFGAAILASPEFRDAAFVPMSLGFLLLFGAVVFYMVTRYGARGAFQSFDVIRSFRAEPDREAGP